MKVLFIGGTGRLSNEAAKLACTRGYDVYILTRGSNDRKKFVDSNFKMIYSNIRNKEETKNALSKYKFDIIVDFLTYNIEQLKDTLDIIDGKYKQYIFISTATVYEKANDDEIITEDKTKIGNKKWNYAYKKYVCEKYLEEYFSDKDSWYTIIRPYVTYNQTRIPYPIIPQKNKYEYSIIHRIKNGKKIPVIDNGNIRTTITNSIDFAKGVVGLFDNKKSKNEAFHITSDECVYWKDTIDIIARFYKVEAKWTNFSIKEFSSLYPEFKEILDGDKGHEMIFDNSKIKNVVKDFQCSIKLADGLKNTIDFYENNPTCQMIDYYWYGKIDRICRDKKETIFSSRDDKLKYKLGYNNCPKLIVKVLRKIGVLK